MKKRDFLQLLTYSGTGALLTAGLPKPLQSQPSGFPGRPNIIIVMTDDQGYGELGCHGNPIIKTSTVGFKEPSADLHKKSPWIFLASLVCSAFATLAILIAPLPEQKAREKRDKPPPVFIHLQTIPKTRQLVTRPAPSRPRFNTGAPVETHEILPDEITIEDTAVEVETLPQVPVMETITDTGAVEEESQIFEYYAVEKPPEPISSIVPEYPPMAERANIDGTVFLRLLVNTEGTVDSVIVEKGPKVFHNSAMNAAKKATFKPAKQNDRPVACWVILPFRYVLEKK